MTNLVPSTRINAVEQIEQALKTLRAHGYAVDPLWAEHNAWLASIDSQPCTDFDRTWARQLPEPSTTEEHFAGGVEEVLTSARCHVGRKYTLSPGQRDVLRERYGLTPTVTVVATNVELYSTEDVIYSLTLKSVEHVDERRRRHVLNEVVLCPASAFFHDAAVLDKAREEEAAERAAEREGRESTSARQPKAASIALAYLT
jgi:hypothetical protein